MKVFFPGGRRITAEYKGHTIETDQSIKSGGTNLFPNPYDTFKAALGSCMGYYVMAFCIEREIPLDSIDMKLDFQGDSLIDIVKVKLIVDDRFPEKYYQAVIKAPESCKVKKQILHPPDFSIKIISE